MNREIRVKNPLFVEFNIGTILIHSINEEDDARLCEVLDRPTIHNTVLVRFQGQVLAEFVNCSDLYNYEEVEQ